MKPRIYYLLGYLNGMKELLEMAEEGKIDLDYKEIISEIKKTTEEIIGICKEEEECS